MPRTTTGNLAHRTLLDGVNRHPLTVERLQAGGSPFTIRQVQRLGEDGLAPRLRDGDDVDPVMVEHCAALLSQRSPGRGQWEGLLALKLAVDGYPMLPEYVKFGAVAYLDALTEKYESAVDTFDTDDDVVRAVSDSRTASIRNVPSVPDNRKRPPIVQAVINGFRHEGIDKNDIEEPRIRLRDNADAAMRDGIESISNGGEFKDPVLATRTFKVLTGAKVDKRAFMLNLPSIREVADWVRDRPWDDLITAFMRILDLGRTRIPQASKSASGSDVLVGDMITSIMFVMILDENQSLTPSTINDFAQVVSRTTKLNLE